MIERGAIRNRQAASQLRDFTGLSYGKITPTDIDGFMEFGGRLFVFIEAKFGDARMSRGQELALERLVDSLHKPPARRAIALVVTHDTQGADVSYADTRVDRFRWDGCWREPSRCGITLRSALDLVVSMYGTAQVITINKERA